MLDVLIALVVAAIVLTLVVMIATRIAMGRRHRSLTAAYLDLIDHLYELTSPERQFADV